MERQAARLTELLSELPPDEVVAFDRIFTERMHEAYSWDLWGAAYGIEGGCSDDGFADFRSWLISMGREVYEAALGDPESLVGPAADPTVEVCSFEDFQYVTMEVLGDSPEHGIPHPREPKGERLSEREDDLEQRYPRLWAKFWK